MGSLRIFTPEVGVGLVGREAQWCAEDKQGDAFAAQDLHQHLDKFSDELKKSEGLRSDILRHSQTFSDIFRHSQTSSQSETQKQPGLISVHQLHRLSEHLRYFQTSSFSYIQIVRISQ